MMCFFFRRFTTPTHPQRGGSRRGFLLLRLGSKSWTTSCAGCEAVARPPRCAFFSPRVAALWASTKSWGEMKIPFRAPQVWPGVTVPRFCGHHVVLGSGKPRVGPCEGPFDQPPKRVFLVLRAPRPNLDGDIGAYISNICLLS